MAYLLDTSVISELRRGRRCDPKVRQWVSAIPADELFISVLTLGEIRAGIESKRRKDPEQAEAIERWLNSITVEYATRTLPVTTVEADRWGRIPMQGRLPDVDGLIAATAMIHGLTVATRNTGDFWWSGVPLVNPFEESAAHG